MLNPERLRFAGYSEFKEGRMEKDTLTKGSAVRTEVEARRSCRHLFWIAGLDLAIILVIDCGGDRVASVATPKDLAPNFSFTLYQGESTLGAATLDLSDLQARPTVLRSPSLALILGRSRAWATRMMVETS